MYIFTAWAVLAPLAGYEGKDWLAAVRQAIVSAMTNQTGALWTVALLLTVIFFTDTHSRVYRVVGGLLHGLTHLAVIFVVGWPIDRGLGISTLSAPANSRVWVSVISVDSFGGVRMVMKGWTPETHGVFTDNLVRVRHQLAMNFVTKSSEMSAQSAGTDIIGGLWHMKTVFESFPNNKDDSPTSKTIWIFSDMVNETPTFYLPGLIESGPEKMLALARAKGLVVPLKGYKVHVRGASTNGLTPETWLTIKEFWRMYFAASGAELVSYSSEADASR